MCSLTWIEALLYFEICDLVPRHINRWLLLSETCGSITYQLGKWHNMLHWTPSIPLLFAYDIYSCTLRIIFTCYFLLNLLYMTLMLVCICYLFHWLGKQNGGRSFFLLSVKRSLFLPFVYTESLALPNCFRTFLFLVYQNKQNLYTILSSA